MEVQEHSSIGSRRLSLQRCLRQLGSSQRGSKSGRCSLHIAVFPAWAWELLLVACLLVHVDTVTSSVSTQTLYSPGIRVFPDITCRLYSLLEQ